MRKIEWACPQQEWLFSAGPQPTLLVGAFEAAKTFAGIIKLLVLLDKFPGSRGAIIRATSSQTRKTTAQSFFQMCTPEMYERGRRNDQDGFVILNNGSRVDFLHLDKPDSMRVLRGLEVNFVLVDQAEELSLEAWDLITVRAGRWMGFQPIDELREESWPYRNENGDPVLPAYVFGNANPTDELHWLYLRFAEESPERAKWRKQGYQCKMVTRYDNKFRNKALDEVYEGKDEDFKRRYVRGEWGNPEEKMFSLSELSIIDPDQNSGLVEKIIREMKLYRILDHGESAPTSCLWAGVDREGRIFFFREYYHIDEKISVHRRAIFALSQPDAREYPLPHYAGNLADPSIFSKTRGRDITSGPRWSVADEYEDKKSPNVGQETAIFWSKADNNEEASRIRVKEFLNVSPFVVHPITGVSPAPMIYFIKKTALYPHGCDFAIKELKQQKKVTLAIGQDGKKVYGDDRDETVPDHAFDCVRYLVLSRPSIAQKPKEDLSLRTIIRADGRSTMQARALHEASRRAARFAR